MKTAKNRHETSATTPPQASFHKESYTDTTSPYTDRKQEEVRRFYVLSLATILLAVPFGLAVVLFGRPADDPLLISIYFWLILAAVIFYPFMILRSPAAIYIADAYDDTATKTARIAGFLLFAYGLLWGLNLLLLTNSSPWRKAEGPLSRIEIIQTDKWTTERLYEFRFQLKNINGWFHYRDPSQERIQYIYNRLLEEAERSGPFLLETDTDPNETPQDRPSSSPVPSANQQTTSLGSGSDTETANARPFPPPLGGIHSGSDNAPSGHSPRRIAVGFRADHGWLNAVFPSAWAFVDENARLEVKALLLGDEILIFDKGQSLTLRLVSLIWLIMCILAGSASLLAARLRSLKGQEAEAEKRRLLKLREQENRALEEKLAELGLRSDHPSEIQKAGLITHPHKTTPRK